MGGYMVSLMPKEAKKYCDSVIVGDGELAYPAMLRDYLKGEIKSFYNMPISVIETPLPRFDLILDKKIGDMLPVQAGRGCPKSCSFCSIYCLYKNHYIRRPIEDVVRDIRQIKDLGFKKFMLLDDNIMSNRAYMMELLDYIIPMKMLWISQCSIDIGDDEQLLKKLAQSGCMTLSFGLESIVGADADTIESIRNTADFIRECKIVVPRFYILTPIPGTIYHKQMLEQKRIYIEDMYSYDGSQAVHIPVNMTPDELTGEYWRLYEKVFEIGNIMERTVFRKEFFKHPGRYLFYMAINLYYIYQIKKRITPNII